MLLLRKTLRLTCACQTKVQIRLQLSKYFPLFPQTHRVCECVWQECFCITWGAFGGGRQEQRSFDAANVSGCTKCLSWMPDVWISAKTICRGACGFIVVFVDLTVSCIPLAHQKHKYTHMCIQFEKSVTTSQRIYVFCLAGHEF